ncbi:MAG: L-rhamnose mutarotase [Paludibacter sp.]|nr:L-rhamnose mutarotase [Paludibacter sp.]
MMKKIGQMIRLKAEGEAEYVRLHAEPWPGVVDQIYRSNIRNYSIFKRGLNLFACFEYVGDDFEKDMAAMAADKATQKWWEAVKPLMEPLDDRLPGEFWSDMEEIFTC